MEKIQTKQQQRAAFALECLQKIGTLVPKDTANFIVGMPTMILTNGIGQTLAFLLSKKSGKEKQVYDILKKWLCKTMNRQFGADSTADIEFIKKFNAITQQEYLQAQQEALRFLEWLKRYARAFEEDKKE
jgi:CRISPR-associated protein Cmr5